MALKSVFVPGQLHTGEKCKVICRKRCEFKHEFETYLHKPWEKAYLSAFCAYSILTSRSVNSRVS